MPFDSQTLYELLPAVYRIRDAAQGGILREVIQVIAEQVAALEENLDQLYDDQFIETCAQWVIPYIGDLIGFRDIARVTTGVGTSRAEVANTIAYRRRKGTASMLEQLARDVTGWDAAVVEFYKRLAVTQYLNHLRKDHHGCADMRTWTHAAAVNSPFDTLAHTVEVRAVGSGRGRYNIPNIGIFLWRVQSRQLQEATLAPVDARRFRFNPLGVDFALYNLPVSETAITHMATPENVPMPLSRRYLALHLADHYGEGRSIRLQQGTIPISVDQVHVCDLSDLGDGSWTNMPVAGVALDPQLGRIAFAQDVDPLQGAVQADYCYGFSAEMGGGPYDRTAVLPAAIPPKARLPEEVASLQDALDAAQGSGLVEVADNGRYVETALTITVAQNQQLELAAANITRPAVILENDAVLAGGDSSEITLNGLLISGGRLIVPALVDGAPNRLQRLHMKHCTLVPGISLDAHGIPQQPNAPVLVVETAGTEVVLDKCIVGALQIVPGSTVTIRDTIVDACSVENVALSAAAGQAAGPLTIANSTVIGRMAVRSIINASNTLFLSTVQADQIQQGCVRFCYLPLESHVPRRYRCLPAGTNDADYIRPYFTSLNYGDPGYCQLRPSCPIAIRQGADDESEMGAFHDLFAVQREAGLRTRLREYLRFGLEAGIFYVS